MVPSLEKTRCPQAPWKKILARYRRLAACMIDESSGYFTPKAVVMALEAHKKGDYRLRSPVYDSQGQVVRR